MRAASRGKKAGGKGFFKGKRVLVIGNLDETASTALQLQRFTDQITMLTNCL